MKVIPHLAIRDAASAIAFYQDVFGAREAYRLTDTEGHILHADLAFGDSHVMLAEENPEWRNLSPKTLGGTPVRLHLSVGDVDDVVRRAVEAGATLLYPVEDRFYGERSGRIEDPFGHVWLVSTPIEAVSPEEMDRRAKELFG